MKAKIAPIKSLGQNFLRDKNVQRRIVLACRLNKQDVVLEIGPGTGAITRLIAPKVKKVTAIEKDRRLVSLLKKEFIHSNIDIVQEDILKFDFSQLKQPVKLIGNLPYNISTPILEKIIKERERISSFYIMVQKEYAKRMVAASGSKTYGSLSCFLQYYCRLELLFKISPGSFFPAPKVESAFLKGSFDRKHDIPAENEELLFKIIRTAFNQRRKTCENALKTLIDKEVFQEAADALKIDTNARAEHIPLRQYIKLANWVDKN